MSLFLAFVIVFVTRAAVALACGLIVLAPLAIAAFGVHATLRTQR